MVRKPNQFDPYYDQIAHFAAQGMNTREILEALNLPATKNKKEQLRRFLHNRDLQIAQRGAQPGDKHRDWKGGRFLDKNGYVLLYMPNHPDSRTTGYILEHRYVMEKQLCRRLTAEEVVHHIDGDKQNNHPDNLELFGSNADHLAETLKGQIPNWTENGKRRIQEGVQKRDQRYDAICDSLGRYVRWSQSQNDLISSEPDRDQSDLSQMESSL